MRLYYFASLLFALMLGMLNPLGLDPAISAMIKSKSRMVNAWLITLLISSVLIVLSTIGYWILANKARKSSWVTVLVHFVPTLLFVQLVNKFRVSVTMVLQWPNNQDGPLWVNPFFLITTGLYIIANVVFVVQFFRLQRATITSTV